MNQDWKGKIAVVTGASSGIGAATAFRLAYEGLHVALIARRYKRLTEVVEHIQQKGGQAMAIPADLSLAEERTRVYELVTSEMGLVDVLVNNAGFGWYGYYSRMPWCTAHEMLQVNVEAVAHLTSLFLPGMQTQNSGHMINVGSIAGGFPNQGVTLYSASKSFLDAFTTGLHRELADSQVHCSIVRAGPVATEFFQQTARRSTGLPTLIERFAVTPQQVADRIWKLTQHPRRVVYFPHIFSVTPWVELLFGWMIDRLGPLLLRRKTA